ncbi:hypothetical protein FBR03_10115 [Betaproteobacteria bacterium PRO1]|nr:hypothetical protein [Betaproteobacteria bacterium PRO1]
MNPCELQISLELRAFVSSPRRLLVRRRGTIKCLAGGRVADFAITLDPSGDDQAIQAVLPGYPRWSEPLVALVARCLELVACKSVTRIPTGLRLAALSVTLDRCDLAEIHLLPDAESMSECASLTPTNTPASISLWSVMQRRLAYEAWGTTEAPPLPAPVSIPVYRHGAIRYCRARDLPYAARSVFAQWAFGRERPDIAEVEDAVHARDISAFLG